MDKPTRTCAGCGVSLAGAHANTKRCPSCNRLKRIKSIPRTACAACGGSMKGKRADAEYCSIPCAEKAGYRRRNPLPPDEDRTCGNCGTSIAHRHLRSKFCEVCADQRREQAHEPVRIDRVCATCGDPFVAKRADSTCCSRKCTQARINAAWNAKHAVRHEPRPCPGCGVEFTPRRSDRVACSTRCYARITSTWVPVWHDKTCAFCAKSFVSKRSDAAFCSQECAHRHHYQINTEAIRKAVAEWRAANPARCRVNAARYRVKRKGWEDAGVGVSFRDWTRLLARHGWRCAYCLVKPTLLHMEHVVPLSRGGHHAIGNILPACPDCNMSKGPKLLVEWRKWR